RQRDLAGGRGRVAAADDELDGRAHLRQLYTERVQDAGGNALTLADQPQKQVLRADVVVVEADGLVLREREDTLGAVVEAVERSHQRSLTRSSGTEDILFRL